MAKKSVLPTSTKNLSHILKQPRITEKATIQAENGVYVFEVAVDVNSREVADAVRRFYKVDPVKVNIVPIPRKKVSTRRRGISGETSHGKKAYVYLKEGDKIEFI